MCAGSWMEQFCWEEVPLADTLRAVSRASGALLRCTEDRNATEETEEMTVNLATAKEISLAAAVFSKLDGKGSTKNGTESFS